MQPMPCLLYTSYVRVPHPIAVNQQAVHEIHNGQDDEQLPENLKPYITAKDKQKKWLFGTVGMVGIAAVLAAMMTAFIH